MGKHFDPAVVEAFLKSDIPDSGMSTTMELMLATITSPLSTKPLTA